MERGCLWEGPGLDVRERQARTKDDKDRPSSEGNTQQRHAVYLAKGGREWWGAGVGSRAREGGTVANGWIGGKLGLCSAWRLGGGRVPFSGERRKREAAG